MSTFIDELGAVSVPLNSARLLIKQNVNGTETDSRITFSNLVANLVNSSSIGVSSGQIPQLITGTYGVALPVLSGENLTNLNFSTIPVGNSTSTGTTKLSDSLVSTSGTTGGFAATPNAVRLLKADYTNLLTTKAGLTVTNTFTVVQDFNAGLQFKRPSSSTQQFLSINDSGRLLNNGTRVLESIDLTNSNESTETDKVTTPNGVEARITKRLFEDVSGVYAKLNNLGVTQTFTDDLIFGTAATGTYPALEGFTFKDNIAVNGWIVVKDVADLTAAQPIMNVNGVLSWAGNDLVTDNLLGELAYENYTYEVNPLFVVKDRYFGRCSRGQAGMGLLVVETNLASDPTSYSGAIANYEIRERETGTVVKSGNMLAGDCTLNTSYSSRYKAIFDISGGWAAMSSGVDYDFYLLGNAQITILT